MKQSEISAFFGNISNMDLYKQQVEERNKENIKKLPEELILNNKKIMISYHALERLRERLEDLNDRDDEFCKKWIIRQFFNGNCKKARVVKKFGAIQFINHEFEKTEYYLDRNGFVYVIADNVLKTIHHNEAKRYTEI